MVFQEKKNPNSYTYTVEDLFGIITIESTKQLEGQILDSSVLAVLKAGASQGTVTPEISFNFKKNNEWLKEDNEGEHR